MLRIQVTGASRSLRDLDCVNYGFERIKKNSYNRVENCDILVLTQIGTHWKYWKSSIHFFS